jgi:hypothetical protein
MASSSSKSLTFRRRLRSHGADIQPLEQKYRMIFTFKFALLCVDSQVGDYSFGEDKRQRFSRCDCHGHRDIVPCDAGGPQGTCRPYKPHSGYRRRSWFCKSHVKRATGRLADGRDQYAMGNAKQHIIEYALGSLARPMSDENLSKKFLQLANKALSQKGAERALHYCWTAENQASAADIAVALTAVT